LLLHQFGNVLYVELSPGIGYSYCENSTRTDIACTQDREDCSPCLSTDTMAADQNVAALEALFGGATPLFPEFKGNPLYLTGESYAGTRWRADDGKGKAAARKLIARRTPLTARVAVPLLALSVERSAGVYIPTLAQAILKKFTDTSAINLHGFWVTDPCTDNDAQGGWLDLGIEFSYQKGQISDEVYQLLNSSACSPTRTAVGDHVRATDTPACRRAWRQYDIATAGIGDAVQPAGIPGLPMYIDPLSVYGPSGGANLPGWISRPDVRTAIHADASKNKVYHLELDNNGYDGYTSQYSACNLNPARMNSSMVEIYQWLAAAPTKGGAAKNFRTMILSSGNIDPVVAMRGTERAVRKFGFPETAGAARRPWFYNASATDADTMLKKPVQWGNDLYARDAGVQVGGFTFGLDTGAGAASIDFVTVRASGHMVPQYAPQKAHHVVKRMLVNHLPIAPKLPAGWDTETDAAFYARTASVASMASRRYGNTAAQGAATGDFAKWVVDAMSSTYTADTDTALDTTAGAAQ
jgi:hypothetical protein